jgi:hypothetical protein
MVFVDKSETREELKEYIALLEQLRSMSLEGTQRYHFIKLQIEKTVEKLNSIQ